MKKLIFLVLLTSVCFVAGAQTKIIWTCPMHPQVQKNSPGNCPICGMTLVKKTIKITKQKVTPGKTEVKDPKQIPPPKKEMEDMDDHKNKDTLTNKNEKPAGKNSMKMDSA